MSVTADPGAPFTAALIGAPSGLVGQLGVRLDFASGTLAVARTTSGITEPDAGTGNYIATLVAPDDLGDYLIVWDTGGEAPITADEPLTVGVAENQTLRPTVDDVALLLRTRTTGGLSTGLGGDTSSGDLTTFTDETRPSAAEVERVIDVSYSAVIGEITNVSAPQDIPPVQVGQVRHAIAIYAAIFIETSFFREHADDASLQVWRDLYAAAIGHVNGAMTPSGRTRRMVSATLASPYSGDDPADILL